MDWTLEEKAKMFDEIASHYYNKNYGNFSKSDIDLLMFSFFLDKELKDNMTTDGKIDYNKVSNYSISKKLCITQRRVESLKIKKQLYYPVQFDWKESFAGLIENARYDRETQKIVLSIPDPNLLIEIKNYIEEKGWSLSTQLNSKLLQLRAEYFLELVVAVSDEENKKEIIKGIKKQIKSTKKLDEIFDDNNIGKSLLSIGVNATDVINNLLSIISPQNFIFKAFRKIF